MNRIARLHPAVALWPLVLILCAHSFAQQADPAPDAPLQLQVHVNRVLVPVVVRDKQGRAVGDLQKEDFQIFDNDQSKDIAAFMVESRQDTGVSGAGSQAVGQALPAQADAASQTQVLPKRIIVFLFDDMHLSTADLVYAKKAAASALDGVLEDTGMGAVVTISGKVNSGVTRDRAALLKAISSIQPRSIYQLDEAECPNIDYYQADLIENKRDLAALGNATRKVFSCNPGLDVGRDYNVAEQQAEAAARRVLNRGNQDVRSTCASIAEFVRRMAPLPGQRTLILVSPGFLSVEQVATAAEQQIIELAAHANVTISALDARGLYTTELKASDHSPDFNTVNGGGGGMQQASDYRRSSMTLAEGALAELSDGTGGSFFHNSNDLAAGFKSLTEPPEFVYLLELSLDGVKPDGSYHRLKVKVGRNGVQVQSRRGYFMPTPDKKKK